MSEEGRLGALIVAVLVTGGIIWGILGSGSRSERIEEVKYILDIDRDGKLSSSEMQVFYDTTGIDPDYSLGLGNLPKEHLKEFLDEYE